MWWPWRLAAGSSAGGKFRGSVASQLDILSEVFRGRMPVGRSRTAELRRTANRSSCGACAAAPLSSSRTMISGPPRIWNRPWKRWLPSPPISTKSSATATTLYDNVAMMKFLEKNSDQDSLIGVCMGEQGIISRVLGVRAGSVFTFAAVSQDEKTAPGQVTAQDLRSTYRIEQVDAATRVYGVAGDPVAHSLSPAIMNAALRRETVNGVYLPLHAKTLKDLLACVRDIPIHGLSITMPYKTAILSHLDNTDSHTTKIGACNTVVRAQDGKLYGFNTDTAGVVRPLEQRITIEGAKILVLGAGGAARAAVFGLKERGAEVYVLNRTLAQAQKLARSARARTLKRADLKKLSFDVIINATPVGMGNSQESPLNQDEIKARYVFEMIYDPPETRLMKLAKAAGAEVIPGVEMFVHQAARQFEIWTGKPAPWDEMLRVVTKILEERAAKNGGNDAKKK